MFKVHQKSYQKLDFPFQEDPIRPRTMPFCQKNFRLSGELHIAKCVLCRHLTLSARVPEKVIPRAG